MPMKAVVVEEFGPPENLKLVELPKPVPKPGEVVVKVAFCGVNFIDVDTSGRVCNAGPGVDWERGLRHRGRRR